MSALDRENKLGLELMMLEAKVRGLEVELDHVKGERDRARDLAVRLEQELAEVTR